MCRWNQGHPKIRLNVAFGSRRLGSIAIADYQHDMETYLEWAVLHILCVYKSSSATICCFLCVCVHFGVSRAYLSRYDSLINTTVATMSINRVVSHLIGSSSDIGAVLQITSTPVFICVLYKHSALGGLFSSHCRR